MIQKLLGEPKMIKVVLLTILFLAQPDVPYELLGSNKYHDRAVAVTYLSKKFSVDDFKLFQIAEKSKDLEAATNATNILKNRFHVNNYEGYPCIFFMAFKKVDCYDASYPCAYLDLKNPFHGFIISFIKSKTDDFNLTDSEQKALTQSFVIDLRFKYKMPVEDINKWLKNAWAFEDDYNDRTRKHQEMMRQLYGPLSPFD
jgi:hypothetical protein